MIDPCAEPRIFLDLHPTHALQSAYDLVELICSDILDLHGRMLIHHFRSTYARIANVFACFDPHSRQTVALRLLMALSMEKSSGFWPKSRVQRRFRPIMAVIFATIQATFSSSTVAKIAPISILPETNQIWSASVNDLAIQGQGFFILRDADDRILYTRRGDFALDPDGILGRSQWLPCARTHR